MAYCEAAHLVVVALVMVVAFAGVVEVEEDASGADFVFASAVAVDEVVDAALAVVVEEVAYVGLVSSEDLHFASCAEEARPHSPLDEVDHRSV